LKATNWHNPDTGTELSPEEGEDHLQRLENKAAERKVVDITSARKRLRSTAKPASPEDWSGIFGDVKKAAPPKSQRKEKHHDVPVTEHVDWHLRNLWETPGQQGGFRTIRELSPKQHRAEHKKRPARKLRDLLPKKLAASEHNSDLESLYKAGGFRDEQHLREFLSHGSYGLLTPHRSDATAQENAKAHEQFTKELRGRGLEVISGKGRWGGYDEPTYMVPNISREQAIELGKKYGQMAVIHGQKGHHEEIATHESYKPMGHGTGFDMVPHEDDNHTEIPLEGGGSAKFRLKFGQELAQ
jgi:hypothetical protein